MSKSRSALQVQLSVSRYLKNTSWFQRHYFKKDWNNRLQSIMDGYFSHAFEIVDSSPYFEFTLWDEIFLIGHFCGLAKFVIPNIYIHRSVFALR